MSPTEEYRALAETPSKIEAMSNQDLLSHFLQTRMIVEQEDRIYIDGEHTNALRLSYALKVSQAERAEIIRRMNAGHKS